MLDFAKKTFEGLVGPLLQGYLPRYIKDIQKEQLNISLWNGEVLLENVELILESFDYLQLPFALKQGRVGRLSIKIPWTKLGREPIVISLEDIFICASQRDEKEWSLDAVEKREFAAKKAKLAAAELAKLSRRVCDNQAGRSFNSYITAKILDSIQVSVRGFHVAYSDIQHDKAHIMFGLRFSSLTIMKQNLARSFSGRVRGGQANKTVEIRGLEIYSSMINVDFILDSKLQSYTRFEGNECNRMLGPFDVSMSVLVNRSGKVDSDAPQYSISGEITGLVISLDEVQLQQILIIWDYLGTYPLREKYGRYRPWSSPLSLKPPGWQKLWWHYAQDSVLSDVREKLKKTSWKYLGQRLFRRKYVNLYKTKLNFLRQDQSVDEFTHRELEQMEKESDIDDILSYRSTAENELQELLSKSLTPNVGMDTVTASVDKSQSDERSSGRPRGWLNWLSHGMLGAGGTDDSSQFSGVISDEVVKDIYEATKFNPVDVPGSDAVGNHQICKCAIKFSFDQILAKLKTIKNGVEIAQLACDGANIDYKQGDELATIDVFIMSGKVVNPCNNRFILSKPSAVDSLGEQPICKIHADVSPKKEFEVSVKVDLQPLEVSFDGELYLNMLDFFSVLKSFESQNGRVLASLNEFEDARTRLLSKADFVLSNRTKVTWDVNIVSFFINIPWNSSLADDCKMVLETGFLHFISKFDPDPYSLDVQDQFCPIPADDILAGCQLQDLYGRFEFELNDIQVKMILPQHPQETVILKKCSAYVILAYCAISGESVLEQLKVGISAPFIYAHMSPSIYVSFLELLLHLNTLHLGSDGTSPRDHYPINVWPTEFQTPVSCSSVAMNLGSFDIDIDLASKEENSSLLKVAFKQLDIHCAIADYKECCMSARSLKVIAVSPEIGNESYILCSSAAAASSKSLNDVRLRLDNRVYDLDKRNPFEEACFCLIYKAHKSVGFQNCTVSLCDAEIHCYPYIVGQLMGFFDEVSSFERFYSAKNASGPPSSYSYNKMKPTFRFQRFGFSNFLENGSSERGISLQCFPFVTIYNTGSLGSLENLHVYPIHEWKKYFTARERKVRNPENASKSFSGLLSNSGSGVTACSGSGHSETKTIAADIDLVGIKVHFHDSSSIVGTLTLPTTKSSLLICEEYMDILCSTEGLILTSSLWTQNFTDYLWGSLYQDLSPLLNMRVRKGHAGLVGSNLEVSFSVQHVCCVLPPEYLSILCDYFFLPDWNFNSNNEPAADCQDYATENLSSIVYKFEILDSLLIFPVESDKSQYLKLEIPHLFSCFVQESTSGELFSGISPECLVTPQIVAKRNHCLDVFVQDLYLSLLLFNDGYGCLDFDQKVGCGNITLVKTLSADIWVRIPCDIDPSTGSSCSSSLIMGRIQKCQIFADDCDTIGGFLALADVINELSLLDESSYNASDVVTDPILTEVRCCIDSLLINLHRIRKDSSCLVPLAEVDMQFVFSASQTKRAPLSLCLSFSSFKVSSLQNSVMLAQCNCTCPTSSVLNITFLRYSQGETELHIILPSLETWIYVSDWAELIDLCNFYTERLTEIVTMDTKSKQHPNKSVCPNEMVAASATKRACRNVNMGMDTSTYVVSENVKQDTSNLVIRSENVGIEFHIPICFGNKAFPEVGVRENLERSGHVASNIAEGKHEKFIALTTNFSTEMLVHGLNAKLKFRFEKVLGTVGICESQGLNSWPFFKIFHVDVDAEICNSQSESPYVKVDSQCDQIDVWFSYQIFYFWHDVMANFPRDGSPQFGLSGLDISFQLRKLSLLLTDGRWTCSGPLIETLLRNFIIHANVTRSSLESSLTGDLLVNYNNIHKLLWEPFVEPWNFKIKIGRKHEFTALLNSSIITDISLQSAAQLNVNFTESFFEVLSHLHILSRTAPVNLIERLYKTVISNRLLTTEMVEDAWGLIGENNPENHGFLSLQLTDNTCASRYAPYILQNLTYLPLAYCVHNGTVNSEELAALEMKDGNMVQPGSSVPIFLNETPEELLFGYRPANTSERLDEKQLDGVAHHFMTIQFDGTALPSPPVSMDLVGLTYFEVDFSKASKKIELDETKNAEKCNIYSEESVRSAGNSSFVVPVVFDVSVQRYSKLIRLYSTVILLNSTLVPLELRFDIPFGLSPKILGPIYPGKEFPLPLHLAEAGCMRWRPLGNFYLWSESYYLSSIISQESKSGFLRSFVCYPSHPSSDPFRCCIAVQSITLPSSSRPREGSFHMSETLKKPYAHPVHDLDKSNNWLVHQVTLSTPLVVNNYLPEPVSLKIESAGHTRTVLLSEVVTPFHHIDPSQDFGLEIHINGYGTSFSKFPRAETFSTIAKFSGTKFSLSETVTFNHNIHNGPVHVTAEKTMDVFSGARELSIFVSFLLYNCTGFPLTILESMNEMEGAAYTIPSCYNLVEEEFLQHKNDGLCLLTTKDDSSEALHMGFSRSSLSENHIVSARKNVNLPFERLRSKPLFSAVSPKSFNKHSYGHDLKGKKVFSTDLNFGSGSSNQCNTVASYLIDDDPGKVKAFMYSPHPISSTGEVMVRVSRCSLESTMENTPSMSVPFPLAPPSGSTNIFVPHSSPNGAYIICVTSSPLGGPFSGRTQAITFQPRYVIANACTKDLCYKQKGTDQVFQLGVGQHSHLHCTDTTRDLLVSVRFIEPGWQWSGSFLPDHTGDTQIKMWNCASGSLKMIRVEVQNADVSLRDEQIVGNLHGNSGTNLILLSGDDTGYMPFRIDNFSKEKVRVYQQRCETFDTIIYPYTSCPYAWDEPCYPHRLTVEVPGERVVGSYSLEDAKDYGPVYLASTSEKPERTLLLSVRAEGATKVLSIVDSGCHIMKEMKESKAFQAQKEGRKHDQKQDRLVGYTEKLSLTISDIGISLIDSFTQELLFVSAKNITMELLQSLDQQKLCFKISALQIDNQLRTTPYPVILSFDREYRSNQAGLVKFKDDSRKPLSERVLETSDSSSDTVFHLAVVKWRKKDISLVSFEYISLRVADVCLELEQELILSLFDFLKAVYSRFQNSFSSVHDDTLHPFINDVALGEDSMLYVQTSLTHNKNQHHLTSVSKFDKSMRSHPVLPSVIPIGAPWQQIYLLARRQRKIYVELLDVAPIKLTLSFSSTPWMLRNGVLTSGESIIHRALMALADVEGAQIHLRKLAIAHHMASWESFKEILIRHYTRQLLHEMYKVFGSAGVIGNPMGFARHVGLGIKDFLSVPARNILQSPTGIITGMAQGTTSLLTNTVYAITNAATQFSKAAHKGIIAFTLDDQAKGVVASHSKGVINEVLEGLTGLLQSPIRGAEKHGLPGVLSGIALGITGLVARPTASILELTGKTAQSIRNKSRHHHLGQQRYRVRLPRPLSRELALRPYSWEEAVGTSVLREADDGFKFKDETLVVCKVLKQAGKFVIVTERLILIVSCSSFVDFGKPGFRGVAVDIEWVMESEIGLESVILVDAAGEMVHIVGSSSDAIPKQNQHQVRKGSGPRLKHWSNPPTPLPLFQTDLELASIDDAEVLLQVLLSMLEQRKEQGGAVGHILHKRNI